ncbi:hypothetical protein C2E21_2041 [Chlorella sorokiniana]|uniref:Uncharacterized protein n=1 Tax=Chlorella sorokiniana TaxID=3076 RepID=A0A2P6TYW4_CHLSO|nr:hypothetical protein C2E21_2041 [Chlorella sorokiniana]|eukprot:PRW59256.1 hypothetical protein C2E21_2041 [Chlorella sorokiniana]
MMKSSPLLQSQDILAALHHAVDSAGDDLLVTERTRGIPSARADGQCMPPSPLSRYLAETAFVEKKAQIRALDRAATERASTPAARAVAAALHMSRLAGHPSGSAEEAWVAQPRASSGSKRGFMGLFACFGR